jgi:hypothetical protein
LDHPPYSPGLAPSDFHLFLRLKKHIVGKWFDYDDEVQEEVMMWFKEQAAEFYDSGIYIVSLLSGHASYTTPEG